MDVKHTIPAALKFEWVFELTNSDFIEDVDGDEGLDK